MPKKHGLGRGLDVLLPESLTSGVPVEDIAIGDIDPNPDQPRRVFSEETIEQLAQSIREQGILQPLLVVHSGGGRYRLVAGERRWRAARRAGLSKVPCLVREITLREQLEIALIENLQREDLNAMEVAQGIRDLMERSAYTQEKAADRIGLSRSNVANLVRLLTLPDSVQDLVREGKLSAGHARALCSLSSPEAQAMLAKEAVEKGYNVRQMEELVAQRRAVKADREKRRRPLTTELQQAETRIREVTGLRTVLSGTEKKGKITLQYYSRDELERLLELMERWEGAM